MKDLVNIQQLIDKESYSEALNICQLLSENHPEIIDYYLYLGLINFLQDKDEEAQEIWMSLLLDSNVNLEHSANRILRLSQLLIDNYKISLKKDNLLLAQKLLTIITELNPDSDYSELEIQYNETINQLLETAITQSIFKNYTLAESIYFKILEVNSQNPYAWHNLSMLYYELEEYDKANNAIVQSLSLDETIAEHYYSLGLILEKQNKFIEAINVYRKTINLNPKLYDAYSNLGLLYEKWGQLPNAEKVYQKAVENIPEHHGNYVNLANVLFNLKQYDEAIDLYTKALQIKPKDSDILYNLALVYEANNDPVEASLNYGYAYYRRGDYDKAIDAYLQYLESNTGSIKLYMTLIDCYKNKGLFEQVIRIHKEALTYYPAEPGIYRSLIFCYRDYGYLDQALNLAKEASKKFPEDLLFQYCQMKLMPIVYEKTEDIQYYRQGFIDYINHISLEAERNKTEFYNKALSLISHDTNFFLSFQNEDDTELLRIHGSLVHAIMSHHYPQYCLTNFYNHYSVQPRLKVAYISSKINGIGSLHLGWLKHANRDRFEIYVYNIGSNQGFFAHNYEVYSDYFFNLPDDLPSIADQILENKPDILVFLDVGMEPTMTQLAGLQLAPVQCTTWGHPVTSGIPTIDYFLTSEAMDSPHADAHYTEQVVKLPNLGFCYELPTQSSSIQPRSYFGLDNDKILYLCCQSHWKYLPQYDYFFPTIAQQVSQSQFVFFESNVSHKITEIFKLRLNRIFNEFNLNVDDWCIFLPRLRSHEYLNVHCLSDVFLDTIGWSGGFTTLDAIACELPVVTLPSEFLRGRQSAGMLNLIGIQDTITYSEKDYIAIAIRLGLDSQWRSQIKSLLAERKSRLFNDISCIAALEAFYESAYSKAVNKQKL